MQKMKSKKGFTLIEMLIVVGIIAVLVAVSIPMVNSSLERARVATDMANERSAKAAALVIYLGGDLKSSSGSTTGEATSDQIVGSAACIYDAASGKVVPPTSSTGSYNYGQCADHKGGYITVKVDKSTGEVTLDWSKGAGKVHLTGKGYTGS